MISPELLAKIKKDFYAICDKGLMSIDETDFMAYKAGYLDCLKRFGGGRPSFYREKNKIEDE